MPGEDVIFMDQILQRLSMMFFKKRYGNRMAKVK